MALTIELLVQTVVTLTQDIQTMRIEPNLGYTLSPDYPHRTMGLEPNLGYTLSPDYSFIVLVNYSKLSTSCISETTIIKQRPCLTLARLHMLSTVCFRSTTS